MNKACYDPACEREPAHELRGQRMCAAHYIEALEHSAHLDWGQWNGQGDPLGRERARVLSEILSRKRDEENIRAIVDEAAKLAHSPEPAPGPAETS